MSITIPISSKIKAAAIATLIVVIGEVANQVTGLYPHNQLVNDIPIVLPVIVGWLKKEEAAQEDVSSQVGITPTPVEWAVVSENPSGVQVSTPPSLQTQITIPETPSVPKPLSSAVPEPVPASADDPARVVDPITGLVG